VSFLDLEENISFSDSLPELSQKLGAAEALDAAGEKGITHKKMIK